MSTSSTDLINTIRERLKDLLPPDASDALLNIQDDSWQHAKHSGNPSGASHFTIQIVSHLFTGLPLVAQHRLVYDRLHDLIPFPIHALSLETKALEQKGDT